RFRRGAVSAPPPLPPKPPPPYPPRPHPGTPFARMSMTADRFPHESRALRLAAWAYLAPRVIVGILLLAAVGLAAFMVLARAALSLFERVFLTQLLWFTS